MTLIQNIGTIFNFWTFLIKQRIKLSKFLANFIKNLTFANKSKKKSLKIRKKDL